MTKPQVDLNGAKVLLVDDTPANLKVLRQALEPEGYSILIATGGEAALRIARSAHPDLILLDVQMPGMDGFEACRHLKGDAATQDIPVIFVTARAETESVVAGFRVGGVDYIVKPFQSEEVLVRVQTHLKIDRLTRDLEASNRALSEANREIREGTERKSRFLANMSHELRTPMNAIIGFANLILRRAGDLLPDRQKDNLSRIRESADHLLDLINDILDLSKIEAGRMDVSAERFSVRKLIMTCCATVGPLVKPGVQLRYEISEDIEDVGTDIGKLRQIVMNLLSNAVKFTDSGEVAIRVEREGEDLAIAVSDTGIGIPAEALPAIFEEFRQVDGASAQQKGTGLGLSITKGLTELLGGTISVESELGEGSAFTVRIPADYRVN